MTNAANASQPAGRDETPLALRILDLFVGPRPPLVIYPRDLVRLLGANKGAAYRACEDLAASGWLQPCRFTQSLSYRLGAKARRLGDACYEGAKYEHDHLFDTVATLGDALRELGREREARSAVIDEREAHLAAAAPQPAQGERA